MPQSIDFEEMKIRANVYAQIYLNYRICHLGIFTEKFADDFPLDMSDSMVRLVAGMAEMEQNFEEEAEKAYLDFMLEFYSSVPDDNDILTNIITDETLDFPVERQHEIRKLIRTAMNRRLESQKQVEGDDETFEACMHHLDRKSENGLTITVVGYPCTFSFTTQQSLPDFSYGCPVRTELLHQKMEELGIESPTHAYTDYVVEAIEKEGQVEYWHLGS